MSRVLLALIPVISLLLGSCGSGGTIDNPPTGETPEIVLLPEINRMVPVPDGQLPDDAANPLPAGERLPTSVSYQQGDVQVSMASTPASDGRYRIQFGFINNGDTRTSVSFTGAPFPDLWIRDSAGESVRYWAFGYGVDKIISKFLVITTIELEPAQACLWEAYYDASELVGDPADFHAHLHWVNGWPDMFVALDE